MSYLNSLPLSEALFELNCSWMFIRLLAVCSLWALFSVFLSDLYLVLKIALSIAIIAYFIYSSWHHFYAEKELIHFQNGRWTLKTAQLYERYMNVDVLVDVGLFILIRFKQTSSSHRLIIFKDQWPDEKLRCFMALHQMLQKQSKD